MDFQAVGPGGTITGTNESYIPGSGSYSGISLEPEEEPEVVRSVQLDFLADSIKCLISY
jgi:hypothetical protein